MEDPDFDDPLPDTAAAVAVAVAAAPAAAVLQQQDRKRWVDGGMYAYMRESLCGCDLCNITPVPLNFTPSSAVDVGNMCSSCQLLEHCFPTTHLPLRGVKIMPSSPNGCAAAAVVPRYPC